jgi:hypothetical protein
MPTKGMVGQCNNEVWIGMNYQSLVSFCVTWHKMIIKTDTEEYATAIDCNDD